MNVPAIKKLRRKLAANQHICGLWITMESPSISAICAAMGLDWIVIDTEHGHLDWKEVLSHVRSAVRSDTVALVRVNLADFCQGRCFCARYEGSIKPDGIFGRDRLFR